MEVVVQPDLGTVAAAAADHIAKVTSARSGCTLALPTGRTAVPLYRELERRHQKAQIDLSGTRTFNLDELILPTEHPASFHSFMKRHAWERIGLLPEHCDIPSGTAPPGLECERYDRALAAASPLDLVILGIGADGHIAYNLPGQTADDTHIVELPSALADTLGFPDAYRPPRAITMGLRPILASTQVLLLAAGPAKAQAISQITSGGSAERWPAARLASHRNLILVLDPEAAAGTAPTARSS